MMTLLEKRVIEEMERLTEKGEDVCEDALRSVTKDYILCELEGLIALCARALVNRKSSNSPLGG
jgi:hypothetical protein